MNRSARTTILSLCINLAYAIGNIALGVVASSVWFVTAGIYYLAIAVVRFVALINMKKQESPRLLRFSGIALMIVSIPLLAMVFLSAIRERGNHFHEILMITIALYAFSKITVAIINMCKAGKHSGDAMTVLVNVSLADALVSIASLQRSMLLSFGELTAADIRLFNILTGSGVCIIVFILGLLLSKKA